MKTLIALAFLGMSQAAIAQDNFPNSCDDYIMRHYKRDLVAQSVSFKEKNVAGAYQQVSLVVKNIGNQTITGTGKVLMHVKINGVTRGLYVSRPWASNETRTLQMAFPMGTLKACQSASIHIDVNHTVGQFGCQTWNNDKKDLKAMMSGKLCRVVLPGGPYWPR